MIIEKKRLAVLVVVLMLVCLSTVFAQAIEIVNLRVEYLDEPLGVDVPKPRLSWIISSAKRGVTQSAYRIQLAESISDLSESGVKFWDTGKIEEAQSVNVVYNGKPLKSGNTYYWRVCVWTTGEEVGCWSKPAKFNVGPMNPNDWKGAKWITSADISISAPLLRKKFKLTKPVQEAYAYIVGLGYYEFYLNGDKVGNHVLDPGTTNYHKRVLYATYDVTDYLTKNENAIGIWLGNGWFRHRRPQRYSDHLQLLFHLYIKHPDGTVTKIVSDEDWKTAASPIIDNGVYKGEIYNACMEIPGWNRPDFDDSQWLNVIRFIPPEGRVVSSQLSTPIRIVRTIRPVRMWEPIEGVYVYDFGQNISGWPRLRVQGGENRQITIRTSPITTHDMAMMKNLSAIGLVDTIDVSPNRSAEAMNIYITKGDAEGEEYEPRFTYQGFRYVQIEGYPGEPNLTSVDARVVHSDVKHTGMFHCSNPLLNQIHQNIIWGQLSNLHSIPTDTPHRDERLGWLGDAHLAAEEAILNFDMYSFYVKWLRDIKDCQFTDGSIPDFVPHASSNQIGTPAWQVAYPLIVYYLFHYYGDLRVVEEHYESLEKWMKYMYSISDNFIITRGRGDWVAPQTAYEPTDGSIPITSTGYYYESAVIMTKLSEALGYKLKQQIYLKLSEHIKRAFNNKFLDIGKSIYGTGSQTSMAFPLYLDIVPKSIENEVVKKLVKQIKENDKSRITTGIIGTKALVQALPKYNQSELLYKLTAHTEFPGWGYMLTKGATTLWERWGGYRYFDAEMNSLNHIMYGSIAEFFYRDIAGIRSCLPGYEEITIVPQLIGNLTETSASVQTIYGEIYSKWKKQGQSVIFEIAIPGNTKAKLLLPKKRMIDYKFKLEESGLTLWENGQAVSPIEGVLSVRELNEGFEVKVLSGKYCFKVIRCFN